MEIALPELRVSCVSVFWLLAIVAAGVGLSRRRPALLGLTAVLCAVVLCVGGARADPASPPTPPPAAPESAEAEPDAVDLAAASASHRHHAAEEGPTRTSLMNSDAILTRALADRALSNVTPLTARQGMMEVMRAGLAPAHQTDRYLRLRRPPPTAAAAAAAETS